MSRSSTRSTSRAAAATTAAPIAATAPSAATRRPRRLDARSRPTIDARARVLQLAERVDSKSIKCGFESHSGHRRRGAAVPSSPGEEARRSGRRSALIDHVNNLKLQYLVELSKLGDSCAGLEERVEAWLNEHDGIFAGATIPFVLMPPFISPGPLSRVRHAVHRLSKVLDRFCDAYPH